MAWPLVRVGDVAEQIRGVTFGKSEASSAPAPDLIPVFTATNITERGLALESVLHIPKERVSPRQKLRKNDLVVTASSGSLSVVGRAAIVRDPLDATFGAFCKVLRPSVAVDPNYFAHFFRTPTYRSRVARLAAGANINNLRNEDLDGMELPLPPLPEQRRIASILDESGDLRAGRSKVADRLVMTAESLFRKSFGELSGNEKGWDDSLVLSDVAEVVSGITKGRRTNLQKREVPYLTVANVQDQALRLGAVKGIEATEAEIQRYRLQSGDLLLTEGGDPDKLGRGALWRGELPECIHQNHVFRVRILDRSRIHPVYLSWLVSSRYGKRYFLGVAKQTTGIASINSRQLKAFPLLTPPIAIQEEFAARIAEIEALRERNSAHLAKLDELFASLQHRAFRGEL